MYTFTTVDYTLPLTLCEMMESRVGYFLRALLKVKIYSVEQKDLIFSHILWEVGKAEEKNHSGLSGWSLSPPTLQPPPSPQISMRIIIK